MKKGDYIVIVFVLILATFIYIGTNYTKAGFNEKLVKISVNNEVIQTLKLTNDTIESIDLNTRFGHNQIEIADGKVWISESDCHNQICVLDNSINQPGDMLVCLPHKLVVEIIGTKSNDVDIVSY